MKHLLSGELNLPQKVDGLWKRELPVTGRPTPVWLRSATDLDGDALDWLASHAQRLDDLDAEARSALPSPTSGSGRTPSSSLTTR